MIEEVLQHRCAGTESLAEITAEDFQQIIPVLHDNRLIQTQALYHGFAQGWISCPLAHHHRHHIARHQADQGEGGNR